MPSAASKSDPESSLSETDALTLDGANQTDDQHVLGPNPPALHMRRVPGTHATVEAFALEHAARRRLDLSTICVHTKDENDKSIEKIYAVRDNYAIYRADDEVCVLYSDKAGLRDRQFESVTAISCKHYELDYITKGLPGRKYFLGQIAVALRIVVEKGEDAEKFRRAREVLDHAISAASEERARIGRRLYLRYAAEYALVLAFVLLAIAFGAVQFPSSAAIAELPAAVGSAALGALFSIAIALRGRTVAPDQDTRANRSDALLRILVGALSGGALILMLTSKIFAVEFDQSTLANGHLADFMARRADLRFSCRVQRAAGARPAGAQDPQPAEQCRGGRGRHPRLRRSRPALTSPPGSAFPTEP